MPFHQFLNLSFSYLVTSFPNFIISISHIEENQLDLASLIMHGDNMNIPTITNGIHVDDSMKILVFITFTNIWILRNFDSFNIFYILQHNRIVKSIYIFVHLFHLQRFSLSNGHAIFSN